MIGADKRLVHDFWDAAACGESMYLRGDDYAAQTRTRYELEPFIVPFADFAGCRGRAVLEIGVGLGADHQRFAESGAALTGLDITERAIAHTRRRFELAGLRSDLRVGDAEQLPFADESFDVVYSWGVLHHTPDTGKAIDEVRRVLRPGGEARVMLYNKRSIIGAMLWVRYSLLRLCWRSLDEVYAEHLESPGTKAFTPGEVRAMFSGFSDVRVRVVLTHGDLLTSNVGQRHRGPLLTIAKRLWPRWFMRLALRRFGFFLLIVARKPIT